MHFTDMLSEKQNKLAITQQFDKLIFYYYASFPGHAHDKLKSASANNFTGLLRCVTCCYTNGHK